MHLSSRNRGDSNKQVKEVTLSITRLRNPPDTEPKELSEELWLLDVHNIVMCRSIVK